MHFESVFWNFLFFPRWVGVWAPGDAHRSRVFVHTLERFRHLSEI